MNTEAVTNGLQGILSLVVSAAQTNFGFPVINKCLFLL